MTALSRLVGDIGGTNVRLALVSDGDAIASNVTLNGDDYASLHAAIRSGLDQLANDTAPEEGVLAVAGPVTDTHFNLTNRPAWTEEVDALRQAVGLKRLTVLNDFAALALAVPRFRPSDSRALGTPELAAVEGAPIALVGPGTGLGVSGLVRTGAGWQPIAGEGGHILLAANNDREAEVLRLIRRYGVRPTNGRLLSGPGLRLIYCVLAGLAPGTGPSAREIASATDSFARETLALFASWLGTFAGDLALIFGARGGVYIGGGVVPKLGAVFPADRFRAAFEDKGQVAAYIKDIPTRLITRPDAGLIGAAAAFGLTGPGVVTVGG